MKFFLIICLLVLTSCGRARVDGPAAAPPDLLEPEGVTHDTAIAVRGVIGRVKQYRASVKVYTKAVYFGETDLRFKAFYARVGQNVKKGDILAELDTEDLLKDIQKQEETITYLQKLHDHENEMKQYDIEIANQELQSMILSGIGDTELELKRIDLQRLSLALLHQQETQRLTIEQAIEQLNEAKAQMTDTVVTAPFDGTVVYMDNIYEGGAVTAFKPLLYIADDSRLYVEYSGSDYFSYNQGQSLFAQIGGDNFELEYSPLAVDEQLAYVLEGRTPPAKFEFVDKDADVRSGSFAAVYVTPERREDVVIIPINALYSGDGENYVYVMIDGVKEMKRVKVGYRTDSSAEIQEGLEEGDEVFVKQ